MRRRRSTSVDSRGATHLVKQRECRRLEVEGWRLEVRVGVGFGFARYRPCTGTVPFLTAALERLMSIAVHTPSRPRSILSLALFMVTGASAPIYARRDCNSCVA